MSVTVRAEGLGPIHSRTGFPPRSGVPAGAARTCGWAREGEGPSRPCGACRGIPQPPYGGGGRQPEQPVDAVELLLLEGTTALPTLSQCWWGWGLDGVVLTLVWRIFFYDASGKQLPHKK